MLALELQASGGLVAAFLSTSERKKLRCVCRRWYFTSVWIQYADDAVWSRRSPLKLLSPRFHHVWTHFVKARNDAVVKLITASLPEVSREDTYALKIGLCESTNTGIRPTFDNARARTGYTIDNINRCINFPGLLLSREMCELRSRIFGCDARKKHWQLALYGGGPGFDAVGFCYLLEFLRVRDVSIHTNVYDNESGWEDAVTSMDTALQTLGYCNATWSFKPCDITEDFDSAINAGVGADAASTDLFLFSFVCVENFRLLRDTNFVFLRSLFHGASIGTTFAFTDSTHRLWPIIWDVAREIATFRICVPYVRGCHNVLVLTKLPDYQDPSTLLFYQDAVDKLSTFSKHLNLQLKYLGL